MSCFFIGQAAEFWGAIVVGMIERIRDHPVKYLDTLGRRYQVC